MMLTAFVNSSPSLPHLPVAAGPWPLSVVTLYQRLREFVPRLFLEEFDARCSRNLCLNSFDRQDASNINGESDAPVCVASARCGKIGLVVALRTVHSGRI